MAILDDKVSPASWLACRAGAHFCALPLTDVIEIMRPLPVEPFPGAPVFVHGLSIIRGSPVPIVDARRLMGEPFDHARRWVTVSAGDHVVAFAFDVVVGVQNIASDSAAKLPPLLKSAAGDVVAAIGTLDVELLLFLQTARVIPAGLLERLRPDGAHAETDAPETAVS